jgi:hypothetical protein
MPDAVGLYSCSRVSGPLFVQPRCPGLVDVCMDLLYQGVPGCSLVDKPLVLFARQLTGIRYPWKAPSQIKEQSAAHHVYDVRLKRWKAGLQRQTFNGSKKRQSHEKDTC